MLISTRGLGASSAHCGVCVCVCVAALARLFVMGNRIGGSGSLGAWCLVWFSDGFGARRFFCCRRG